MAAPAVMAPETAKATQAERRVTKAAPQGGRKMHQSGGARMLEVVKLAGGSPTDLAQALMESTPDASEAAVLARALVNAKKYRPGEDVTVPESKGERQAARRGRLIRRRSRELVKFVRLNGGSPAGLIDVLAKRGGGEGDLELASAALRHASAGKRGAAPPAAGVHGGPGADAVAKPACKDEAAGKACIVCSAEFCAPENKKACGTCQVLVQRLKVNSGGECERKHVCAAFTELGRGANVRAVRRRARELAQADVAIAAGKAARKAGAHKSEAAGQSIKRRARSDERADVANAAGNTDGETRARKSEAGNAVLSHAPAVTKAAIGGGSDDASVTRAVRSTKDDGVGCDVCCAAACAVGKKACGTCRVLVQRVKANFGGACGRKHVRAAYAQLGGDAKAMVVKRRARELAQADVDASAGKADVKNPVAASGGAEAGAAVAQVDAKATRNADAAAPVSRMRGAAGQATKRSTREVAHADVATAAEAGVAASPARRSDDGGVTCDVCGAAACAPGRKACGSCRVVIQRVKVNSGGVCGRKHVRAAYAELGSDAKVMAVRRRARQLAHADVNAAVAAAVGAAATSSAAETWTVKRRARELAQAAAAGNADVKTPATAATGGADGAAATQSEPAGGDDADVSPPLANEAAAKCDVCGVGACAAGNKACGTCRVMMRQLKLRTGGVCLRKHVRAAFTELGSDAKNMAVRRRARELAQADVATTAGSAEAQAPATAAEGVVEDAPTQAAVGGKPDADATPPPHASEAAAKCDVCGGAACASGNKACGTCRKMMRQLKLKTGGVCQRKHVRAAFTELGSDAKSMAVRRRARELAQADVPAPVAAAEGAEQGAAVPQADVVGGPDADVVDPPASEAAEKCNVCGVGACAPGNKACGTCRVMMRQLKLRTGGLCERKHVRAAFTELGSDAKNMAVRRRARELAKADAIGNADVEAPAAEAAAGTADVEGPVAEVSAVRAVRAVRAARAAKGGTSRDAAKPSPAPSMEEWVTVAKPAEARASKPEPNPVGAGSETGTAQAPDRKPRRNLQKREAAARTPTQKPGTAAAAGSSKPAPPKEARAVNQTEKSGSPPQQESGNGAVTVDLLL